MTTLWIQSQAQQIVPFQSPGVTERPSAIVNNRQMPPKSRGDKQILLIRSQEHVSGRKRQIDEVRLPFRMLATWLHGPDTVQPTDAQVARLAATDPAWFRDRVERTLAGGTAAQRGRMAGYALGWGLEGMDEVVAWGREHARRVGPEGAAQEMRAAP
mgnify:CR=1 FL=1